MQSFFHLICNQSWMEAQLCCSVTQVREGGPWPALLWPIVRLPCVFSWKPTPCTASSCHCIARRTTVPEMHETALSWQASLRVASTESFQAWCQEPQPLGVNILTMHKICFVQNTHGVFLVFMSLKIVTYSSVSSHCTNKPDTGIRLSGRWPRGCYVVARASNPWGSVQKRGFCAWLVVIADLNEEKWSE